MRQPKYSDYESQFTYSIRLNEYHCNTCGSRILATGGSSDLKKHLNTRKHLFTAMQAEASAKLGATRLQTSQVL